MLILELLILITLANGTPVLVKKLLGNRFAYPLDGGAHFFDGNRLFGASKTLRGVLSAIVVTTLVAIAMGYDATFGMLFGATAMAGDLFSSFVKRRLNMPSSSMALGLDQIPESLFPLLAVQHGLPMTVMEMLAVVVIFFVGELLTSRILYKLHIRDKPY